VTGSEYYLQARSDLLPYLPPAPPGGLRILELGCGGGATGALLKERGIAAHVTGVEVVPEAVLEARKRLDAVVAGDLERLDLPPGPAFDLVLAADVVEHLIDPWTTLRRVLDVLRPGGHFVTSTPNIRYWRILYDLGIHGRWEYADSGILDRTHLRFFTRASILELHDELGLIVEDIGYAELSGKRALLDRMTRARLRDFLSAQHVVRSRKPG
jgi:SAM-dependent methyltransferase